MNAGPQVSQLSDVGCKINAAVDAPQGTRDS